MTRQIRPWIWLGLALVVAGIAWFVPLFDVLGFELAVVAAAFAAVCGLDLGAAHARALQAAERSVADRANAPSRALARGLARAIGVPVAIALVPALIAALHGIWKPTCDWAYGIHAYAVMPLASAALGGALGHLLAIACGRRAGDGPWWKPHRSTAIGVIAPVALLALAGLWRFYSEPPVFVYDALIGYFPGNMYDENIVLGAPLWWSRLEQLAWVAALGCAVCARLDVPAYRVRLRAPKPWRGLAAPIAALACLGGALALHAESGALGYAVDAGDIQAELGGRYETDHFIIYYAKTAEIQRDIELIARDHELRYAEVVAQIGEAPAGKLRSYYFADTAQKARWFGARNVEMAKPWRHEIYIDHRAFPHSSLRHEIAHAVASAFGDPWFGVAAKDGVLFNPGLIEGLAVALDWPGGYEGLTPHQAVRAMALMGIQPSISELLSIKFFEVSSSRGYTTAGSFLRFLLDTYGAAKLRELYRSGGDFAGAYGVSLGELEQQWRAMIDKIELAPDVVEGTRERFRGGGVFSRPCPHAIAARRDRALAALGKGDRDEALALLRDVCADAPDEPRNLIDLGGMLVSGDALERAEGQAIWLSLAGDEQLTSSLRAEALDKLAHQADTDPLRLALIERARALPLDVNERRQLDAEAFALRAAGPAGPALRAYFFGDVAGGAELMADAQRAADVEPSLGMGHYLLGLQRMNAGDFAGAASELDAALAAGLPGDNFVRFCARRLAIAAYRTRDLSALGRAIAAMRGPATTEVDHLLADDWQRRIDFDKQINK